MCWWAVPVPVLLQCSVVESHGRCRCWWVARVLALVPVRCGAIDSPERGGRWWVVLVLARC